MITIFNTPVFLTDRQHIIGGIFMNKLAIVYWSGTGNTEQMATAILEGMKQSGADAQCFEVEQFTAADIKDFDGFAFGCPAMGDEVLEESSFEPFFAEAEKHIKNVPVVLFGSYGWGRGAWMKLWADRTRKAGAKLFNDGLAIENSPQKDDLSACSQLGAAFAKSLL